MIAPRSITLAMDRFAQHVAEGHDETIAYDAGRAYMFNRAGDVVTTRIRPGEHDDTTRFRLLAALTAISISDASHG